MSWELGIGSWVLEMTDYLSMVVPDLLDAFASNEPIPGGGSAAALGGAVGTSLLIMVAGLPKTRTGSPEEAADLAEAAARLRPLRDTLASLVQQDSDAYGAVLDARRLPNASESDRQSRRAAMQTAMREATEVPLETMRLCQQALRGGVTVAANGSRQADTDTATGIEFLRAALRSAGLNVDVNLGALSDASFTARTAEERRQLASDGEADARRALEMLGLEP